MSQRKGVASSKFGHLFGDSSESSSSANKESRLSSSGDLYKDPLAVFIPPVTATTTTTRSGASSVKATISSPTSSTATASRNSPPSSGSSSRSSSRLQHHSLFSSLTGDSGGSSLFDSAPSSSALSAAKRDLLFGDGASNGSSSSRRISTPPLSRNNNNVSKSSSQQSSRVSTPPLGIRVTTALDPDSSPLGFYLGDNNKQHSKDDDSRSITSPLSAEPLTRTSSQASVKSHESEGTRSNKSGRSMDNPEDVRPSASKPGTVKATSVSTASKGLHSSMHSQQPTTSSRPTPVKKTSMDQSSRSTLATNAVAADPIFNPLAQSQSTSGPPDSQSRSLKGRTSSFSPSSMNSSQSIETFQSISRASSPSIAPPPLIKSGFESECASPTLSTTSRIAVNVVIPDDATQAFANDLIFSTGPMQQASTVRSSSFLDSGISHARTFASTSDNLTSKSSNAATISNTTMINPGVGAGTVGQSKTRSGFSLGEDVADSGNPWMNTLADSLEQTKLMIETTKVDYTQSDAGQSFLPEVAFALPSPSSTHKTLAQTSHYPTSTLSSIPSLEEDMNGFQDIFTSSTSSKSRLSSSTSSKMASLTSSTTNKRASSSLSTPTWNLRDAAEAAAMDPEFQGSSSLLNQGTAKVLAMMQMPKDPLDKDVSAKEVFDNPWE
ncbi:hypothetical protein BG011_007082 [Mortierella polycephala]|uniref:Uncharacterized protein n=1 Tax=Mortierella polycephala TaxID=41804 RepID=A0A9P6PR21_9FUNG|nr:hypothetical protein BG011_007082 [Mortierella polycephala]